MRRNDLPKNIEVSDKHRKLRLVLMVLLLAVGVTLIVVALSKALITEPGWTTITANTDADESCSGDFVFQYQLGQTEQAANFELRAVTQTYTQAAKDAYAIFHSAEEFEGVHNLCYLSNHIGTPVQVPQVLYDALALLEQYENRALYFGPVYAEYIALCLSNSDASAAKYDPEGNNSDYISRLAAFASDEQAIDLELMEDGQVQLNVSDDYLQFAEDQGINEFLDFYWLKNAFVADYIAEELTKAGYTNGMLSSFDGYQRNLDSAGAYSQNILDRIGTDVISAAVMEYSGIKALVSLRNYPTSALAVQQYYQWQDGRITSCHIGVDGKNHTAINDLMGTSRTLGCAQVLLELYPVYVAETLDAEAVKLLAQEGVDTVYCQDTTVIATDRQVSFADLYAKDNIVYKAG